MASFKVKPKFLNCLSNLFHDKKVLLLVFKRSDIKQQNTLALLHVVVQIFLMFALQDFDMLLNAEKGTIFLAIIEQTTDIPKFLLSGIILFYL